MGQVRPGTDRHGVSLGSTVLPPPPMRRLAVLALVLDTLAGGAFLLARGGFDVGGPAPGAYVEVAGTCVEVIDADSESLAGRPVDAALCRVG